MTEQRIADIIEEMAAWYISDLPTIAARTISAELAAERAAVAGLVEAVRNGQRTMRALSTEQHGEGIGNTLRYIASEFDAALAAARVIDSSPPPRVKRGSGRLCGGGGQGATQ